MNVQSPNLRPADAPAVRLERDGAVAIVTLDRAERANTLSEEMLGALGETFSAIAKDRAIKAVVLTSASPKIFCPGHDLKELTAHRADADKGRAYFTKIMTGCSAVMQQIVSLPQPVIAAVNGVATAAGCQLVASCDLAVASETARFATPGVNIGLFCSTPMVALSRNVAKKHAMEMLLLGEMIDAQQAQRIGLINRITEPGRERDDAVALAQTIASKSTYSIKVGKEAFYRQAEMNLAGAYSYVSQVMVENLLAADAQEGICAFIEKRHPKWEDK